MSFDGSLPQLLSRIKLGLEKGFYVIVCIIVQTVELFS